MVHNVGLQAFLAGTWTDVPLMATAVKVTRGVDSYGTWPRPSRFECEIDNDTLNYDPSRPTSLLYGVAGRNTRVRIRPNLNTYLYAEASTWTPQRTIEHVPGARRGRSSTRLVAEGLLRRLGTWSDPIRSPMYRTISARATSVGHWPLEDDRDATALSNSEVGAPLASIFGGPSIGESESPQGAAKSVKVGAATRLTSRFVDASTTAGWQVSWSFKLPAVPPSATFGQLLRWTTSNGYTWTVDVNNTNYRVTVTDSAGGSLLSSQFIHAGRPPNDWLTFRVKASASGGTVTVEPAWYAQGDTAEVGVTVTFAGSVGALRQWWQDGNAVVDGGWFSHIFGVTGTADNLVGATAQRVFNGYSGEQATERFLRVMGELGLTGYSIGPGGNSMPMGPQRPGTLLDILKEIRDTDDARIDDERLDIALTMTMRRGLYNQTPALTLVHPGDVYEYEKEIGDLNTHNRVTVKNTSGGEVTVSRDTGPMSTQPPPAGVGLNPFSVDVNVADESQLEPIASWHLAKGTLDLPLYRSITLNLTGRPALAAPAISVREGNYITVTGLEAETVHLLVVGIVRQTTPGLDLITFQCEPYDPYLIGVWDNTAFRYDSRTSTLNTGATASATSLVVTFTDRDDAWSTTATPYAWLVGGERVTVTSITAPAGSGPWTQTATVVRAVNGISKPQTAGTEVHLADAKRWGL